MFFPTSSTYKLWTRVVYVIGAILVIPVNTPEAYMGGHTGESVKPMDHSAGWMREKIGPLTFQAGLTCSQDNKNPTHKPKKVDRPLGGLKWGSRKGD